MKRREGGKNTMAISKHEEKKQLSEDNERRDLEKNNFVFPPAYSRG